MSFNIEKRGTVAAVHAEITALEDGDAPKSVRKILALELDRIAASGVPDDAEIRLHAYGHLGWSEEQTGGESSVHVSIVAPADFLGSEHPEPEQEAAADEAAEAADDADKAEEAEEA